MNRFFLCLMLCLATLTASAQETVKEVMDSVVTRLYETRSLEQLQQLTDADVLAMLSPQEREVLATRHWHFDTNVPVVVSVLRNVEQQVAPFWLAEKGFTKTELRAVNMEGWQYEVWQKEFPAGTVGLGIGGFDPYRPHYLLAVGPARVGDELQLSNSHPANQVVQDMKPGVLTYHDWTELVLTEVPQELVGHKFLSTIRGRGIEAAVVGAFRETPFPSSEKPAPIALTWSGDPATTQTIQWRTNTAVEDGAAKIRKKGTEEFEMLSAERQAMEDRMLANDRYCHWFSATATALAPGTTYEYQVGSPQKDVWSEVLTFTTAPAEPKPFTFLYFSDTHSNESWGKLLEQTFASTPEAAFATISGDLVGTGLEREDWDLFFTYGQPLFQSRPVMPAIGNHDAQYGLGAQMYLDLFGLPKAGPSGIAPEAAYTFRYSNAQFFILDVMSDREAQAAWLEEELKKSDAQWKIAVFHFPPFARTRQYAALEKLWGTLFDQYHLDLVLTGHVHTYMRSKPLRGGEVVEEPGEGTIYVTSVSIPSRPARAELPEYMDAWVGGGSLAGVVKIDGPNLHFKAVGADGTVKDEFEIRK